MFENQRKYNILCAGGYEAFPHSVAWHDLMDIPEFKYAAMTNNQEAAEKILYDVGFRLDCHYYYEDGTYVRAKNNKVVKGRIVGYMRDDKEWLTSYAPIEAVLHYTKDLGLKEDLNNMMNSGSFFSEVVEEDGE